MKRFKKWLAKKFIMLGFKMNKDIEEIVISEDTRKAVQNVSS